jgi:hypothetical protein
MGRGVIDADVIDLDEQVSHRVVARYIGRTAHSANAFINRYSELLGYPHTGSGNHRTFKRSDLPIFKALSDASMQMPSGFPNEWVTEIAEQLRAAGRGTIHYETDGMTLTITLALP